MWTNPNGALITVFTLLDVVKLSPATPDVAVVARSTGAAGAGGGSDLEVGVAASGGGAATVVAAVVVGELVVGPLDGALPPTVVTAGVGAVGPVASCAIRPAPADAAGGTAVFVCDNANDG
jgi:hypothetical protein